MSVVLVGTSACSADPAGAPNPNGKDEGAACTEGAECKSLTCNAGKCTAVIAGGNPTDKVKNGGETDVDCGGPAAPKCGDGKTCNTGTDCESAVCTGGKCMAPAPDDKLKNGDESDVDCGGSKAPKCAVDKACTKNEDCSSDACSYAKKCVEYRSCTGHFGGDTCGAGETGEPDAKHENCCTTVTNSDGLKIGKYLITAGRMRAFVERYNGNLQQWAATKPKGWDDAWTSELPASLDEANAALGPEGKKGCSITTDGKGARTYWQPPIGEDKNDFPQDVLDEKALNCFSWHMAQALCAFDGGRIPNNDEIQAMVTNDGEDDYPWQFQDKSTYKPKTADERVVSYYSYHTPNPPADMRKDGTDPLDRTFWIAPPGRRPKGANKIGVQDALGNMLNWVNDDPQYFTWTMSWEEHQ
ncbi:MAG TPA: SUMF1/EgtB/PvdO family nonheme iron enzyme, partial [Labilithrix sp.]|nr:SUMF1/EgtB/PvdO family nonheme iron enzyme [Labilithrix sp.]